MESSAIDFEAIAAGATLGIPDDGSLQRVAQLAALQLRGEQVVEDLKTRLSAANARLKQIVESELPDAMDSAGVSEFTTTDGRKVKVAPFLVASLADGKMGPAVAWLRAHGHDGLIVRAINVTLPKGEDAAGEQIVAALRALGVEPKDESKVNTASLKSWINEMLESEGGATLPLEVFGAYKGRRSVIK